MATGAKWTSASVSQRLNSIAAKTDGRLLGALYRRGEAIMANSKENYVPVDLGTLKNTGKVTIERQGTKAVVVLSYGDSATPYALAVHETPSQYDPPSWRGRVISFSPAGTGAKYLEKPFLAAIPSLPQDIANDLALTP